MKKLFALTLLVMGFALTVQAQKIGYVDTKLILSKMDEYNAIQAEIDQLSQKWQKELEDKYKNIEKMYADYQAEKVLLPEDVRKQREEDIMNAEREAKEFKKAKFGYDGELYKIQDEKIKPLQDKVFDAVEAVAAEKKLDFIFDKASQAGIIYSNPIYDRTNDVLAKLGIKN